MKKVALTLILILLSTFLFAQVPEAFSYQAVVRDISGNPVIKHAVSFKFSILKGIISGTVVYTEKHDTITNELGLVNFNIGNGTDKVGDIATIDWGVDKYFLKIEIDPNGGSTYIEMGTTQMLSVPYAVYAKTSSDAVKLVGNQTISGNKIFTGTTTVPTPVNSTDATTKEYVDKLLSIIQTIQVSLKDADGNNYKALLIGDQVWMAENLKTTKYNDGTSIPLVTDALEWTNLTTPGYCWYNNNESNKDVFGALYNWYTVNTGILCPAGWHIPTDTEWTTLENYLITNGFNYDGTTTNNRIAKALASITGWTSSLNTGTVGNTDYPSMRNATGFTALPGGYRSDVGVFFFIGVDGRWWSATLNDVAYAWYRYLRYIFSNVGRLSDSEKCGFSVRCIKN